MKHVLVDVIDFECTTVVGKEIFTKVPKSVCAEGTLLVAQFDEN